MRVVGTGASFVGKLGVTVRAGVDIEADEVAVLAAEVYAGLGGVLGVGVDVVVVEVAARGALFTKTVWAGDEVNVRRGIL